MKIKDLIRFQGVVCDMWCIKEKDGVQRVFFYVKYWIFVIIKFIKLKLYNDLKL